MLKSKKAQIGSVVNWGFALIIILFILLIFILIGLLFINHSNLVNFFEPSNILIENQNNHLISKSDLALLEIKEVISMNTDEFNFHKSQIGKLLNLEND